MTRIAVIDNHGQFTHLEGRALRDLGIDHDIIPNTRPAYEVEEEYDALVLSGGPSMERIGKSTEYLDIDLPVLGICLGHQVIAKHYGGRIGEGSYGGFADVEVELLENDGLFQGFDSELSTWASHADEVKELPQNFVRTARSDVCGIEAMRHQEEPIYGIQWHPEVSHTEKGLDLFRNFVSIVKNY